MKLRRLWSGRFSSAARAYRRPIPALTRAVVETLEGRRLFSSYLYSNAFSSGTVGPEWSKTNVSTSPSGQTYLGQFGGGNNGTLTGGATWTADRTGFGSAIQLNGTTGYVSVEQDETLLFGGTVTVSVWVNLSSTLGTPMIADNVSASDDGGFRLGIDGGKVYFEVHDSAGIVYSNDSISGGTTLSTGIWYQLTGTYSDGVVTTYVNGSVDRVATTSGGDMGVGANGTMLLGKSKGTGSGNYLSGAIDDFQIFNRALSSTETAALPTGATAGLVDYLKFNENSGIRAYDSSNSAGVTLNLTSMPAHANLTVSFNLYIIGSWDGRAGQSNQGPDIWTLTEDGTTLIQTTFANGNLSGQSYPGSYPTASHPKQTGAAVVNSLGYAQDAVYHLTYSFSHTSSSLTLGFIASELQGITDESFGIDDVTVTAPSASPAITPSSGTVNEGSTYSLTLFSGAGATSWSIDWGDGSTSDIDGDPNTASHIYDDNGTYSVSASANNSTGAHSITPASVVVSNVAPSALLSDNYFGVGVISGEYGDEGLIPISFTDQYDPSSADTDAGFLYSYDFDNDGNFEITDSKIPMAYLPSEYSSSTSMRGRIKDKDGNYTDYVIDPSSLTSGEEAPSGIIIDGGSQNWRVIKNSTTQTVTIDLTTMTTSSIVQIDPVPSSPGNYQIELGTTTNVIDMYDAATYSKIVFLASSHGDEFHGYGDSRPTVSETFTGGSGNDYFCPGTGAATMSGGGGYDTIDYSYSGRTTVIASIGGTVGDQTIGSDVEVLVGTTGADNLSGADTSESGTYSYQILGMGGNDTLTGGGGGEVHLIPGITGSDTLQGTGSGLTIADYKDSGRNGVKITLGGSQTQSGGDTQTVMAGVRWVWGTTAVDTLNVASTLPANAYVYYLWGEGGNDSLGGGGALGSTVFLVPAASGNDTLQGSSGAGQTLVDYADSGRASVSVGIGANVNGQNILANVSGVLGTPGNDDISVAFSAVGNYELYGEDGNDGLTGGSGDDFIDGGNGADYLIGGPGNDRIYGDSGIDNIYGGDGNDVLYGSNDSLNGSDGDTITGGNGNDTIFGSLGVDTISGNDGLDQINGGSSYDLISVGSDTGSLGNQWTERNGQIFVDGDVTSAAKDGITIATVAAGSNVNVVESASISVPDGQAAGLIARYSSSSGNYYRAELDSDGYARIISHVGTDSVLASAADQPASGVLRFEVVGTTLNLFINDQLVVTATNSTISSGEVGIYISRDSSTGTGQSTIANFSARAANSLSNAIALIPTSSVYRATYWYPDPNVTYTAGISFTNTVVGDFNGDGSSDVAGVDSSGNWYVGISNGIASPSTALFGTWASGMSFKTVGDFNGDGLADVAGQNSSGTWQILLSTGSSFVSSSNVPVTTGEVFVGAGDFNGDGRTDLLTRDTSTNSWHVLLSTGSGFVDQVWAAAVTNWADPQIADFDGDGRADIAVRDTSTGNWHIGISDGVRFNGLSNTSSAVFPTGTFTQVLIGDFNGDKKVDILGRTSDTSSTWYGSISSAGSYSLTTWAWTAGASATSVQAADLDGDGKSDLIGQTSGTWIAALSTGSGFTSPKSGSSIWSTNSSVASYQSTVIGNFFDQKRAATNALQSVYNTIQYDAYPGAVQGAQATLEIGSGNDWDQDALLISELNAAGISARYVSGKINESYTDVENWLDVSDNLAADNVLSEAGLNPTTFTSTITFDHTWVEALIPSSSGIAWTTMDPSWKLRPDVTTGQPRILDVVPTDILDGANLALETAATEQPARSPALPVDPAHWAVDGDLSSEWVSNGLGTKSIVIDLGQVENISRILLSWDTTGYATSFTLSGSLTSSGSFTTMKTVTGNSATTNDIISFTANTTNLRYLQLQCTAAVSGATAYKLAEIQVFGGTDLAQGKSTTATSTISGSSASNAVDDNTATAWSAAYSATASPSITVDLGVVASIGTIKINWGTDYASSYLVSVSSGSSYTPLRTVSSDGSADDITALNSSGRYVRITLLNAANGSSYSLDDLQVYSETGNTLLPLETYEEKVQTYLTDNNANTSIADLAYTGPIIQEVFKTVSDAQLPNVSTIISRPYSVPSASTSQVQITVSQGSNTFTELLSVPSDGRKTINVNYAPSGSNFTPEFVVGGIVVASATWSASSFSPVQIQVETITSRDFNNQTYVFDRNAGDPIAVVADGGQVTPQLLLALQAQMNLAATALYDTPYVTAEAQSALLANYENLSLTYAQMKYFSEVRSGEDQIGALSQNYALHYINTGIMTGSGEIEVHWDLPVPVFQKNTYTDNPGVRYGFVPIFTLDDTSAKASDLFLENSSALESYILEEIFNAESVSTVIGMQWAEQHGYTAEIISPTDPDAATRIGALNIDSTGSTLHKDEIRLAVLGEDHNSNPVSGADSGYTVTIYNTEITIGSWTGAVWTQTKTDSGSFGYVIAENGETDHGGYLAGEVQYLDDTQTQLPLGTFAGDPVTLATGNLTQDETDFTIPNVGFPLTFSRHYDSLSTADVGMGIGWVSSYSDYLKITRTNNVVTNVTWTTGAGLQHIFTSTNGTTFTDPPELFGTFAIETNGYFYTDKDGTQYHFQEAVTGSGRLTSVVDRNHNQLNITYPTTSTIIIQDNTTSSHKITLSLNATGHITSAADFTGRTWKYTYTTVIDPITSLSEYYLTQVSGPTYVPPGTTIDPYSGQYVFTGQLSTTYSYNFGGALNGLLKAITDNNSSAVHTYAYYPDRRLFSVTDPAGGTEYFEYDGFHEATYYTDELGRQSVAEFNDAEDTIKTINPDSSFTTNTWNGSLLTSSSDEFGQVATYQYDSVGNLTRQVAFDGIATTYSAYDSHSDRPGVVTVGGTQTTSYAYDSTGNVTKAIDPDGDITTTLYAANGEITSKSLPRGNGTTLGYGDFTTSYVYNTAGQVTLQTSALSLLEWDFDETSGTTIADSSGNGHSATLSGTLTPTTGKIAGGYSFSSSSTAVSDPAFSPTGSFTVSFWLFLNSSGNTTFTIGAAGSNSFEFAPNITTGAIVIKTSTSGTSLSAAGALSMDTAWHFYSFVYQANGSTGTGTLYKDGTFIKTQTSMPAPATWSGFKVVGLTGKLDDVRVEGRAVVTNAYDAQGNLRTTTDPTNISTTNTYDLLNEVITTTLTNSGGSPLVTSYTYSDELLKSTTDPRSLTTSTTYDLLRRPTRTTNVDGTFTTRKYDAAGNLTAMTDAAGRTTYIVYDSRNRAVETISPDQSINLMFYDAAGRMDFSIDPRNGATTNNYDAAGRLTLTTDPLHQATSYTYDNLGELKTKTDLRGTTSYSYDLAGRTTQIAEPAGDVITNTYDADGNLIQEIDADPSNSANNRTTSIQYDTHDRPTRIIDALQNSSYTGYDAAGRIIRTADALGNVITKIYDGAGRLQYLIQPSPTGSGSGPTTTYSYDADSNITRVYDPLAEKTTYAYDALNRTTLITDALNNMTREQYDVDGEVVTSIDALNNSSYTQYDSLGRVITQIGADPDGEGTQTAPITRYFYDAGGNLTSTTDPLGNITSYQYDSLNRKTEEIDPNPSTGLATGPATTYAYSNDNLTSVTDPLGNITSFTYYAGGRKQSQIDPAPGFGQIQPKTTWTYDVFGDILTVRTPQGSVNSYIYDALGRKVKETDDAANLAATTSWSYDAAGNVKAVIDPLGIQSGSPSQHTTTYAYDHLNRKTSETDPSSATGQSMVTSWAYDLDGNVTAVTDPRGIVTTYTYDALNRKQSQVVSTDITSWAYDADGNVISVTDPNTNVTSYSYDHLNRMTLQTDAASGHTTSSYDAAGNVTKVVDPRGAVTSYVYDHLNRKTGEIDDANNLAATTSWAYDVDNNVTAVVDPLGNASGGDPTKHTTSYTYDGLNRKHTETDPHPDSSGLLQAPTTTWLYDVDGNISTVTDPRGGITTFSYDVLNRKLVETDPNPAVTGETSPKTTWGYDVNNNITTVKDPDGGVTSYTYDNLNRKLTETDPVPVTGQTAPSTTWAYDQDGNVTTVATGVTASTQRITSYAYDSLDHRTLETDPAPASGLSSLTMSWVYDNEGNVLQAIDALGKITTYGYDSLNRKTSETDPSPGITGEVSPKTIWAYDADGNTTAVTEVGDSANRVTTYQYDLLNRKTVEIDPASTTGAAQAKTTWAYDLNGNLTTVVDPLTNVTTYVYDNLNRKVREVDPSPGGTSTVTHPTTNFTYNAAGDLLVETDPGGNATTYTYDGLGRRLSGITYTSTAPLGGDANLDGGIDDDDFALIDRGYAKYNSHVIAPGSAVWTQGDFNGDGIVDTNDYLIIDQGFASQNGNYYSPDMLAEREAEFGDDFVTALISSPPPSSLTVVGGTPTSVYDPAGHVTLSTDRDGQVTSYTYDLDGRQTKEQWISGSSTVLRTISSTYDAAGELLTVSDSSSTYTYAYDGDGRQTLVDNYGTPNAPHDVVSYTYDANGRKTAASYTMNGAANHVDTWTYDYDGRVFTQGQSNTSGSISAKLTTYTYNADGTYRTIQSQNNDLSDADGTAPTGVSQEYLASYSYDLAGRLTAIGYSVGTTGSANYSWTYDTNDQMLTDTGPAGTVTYVHDNDGQVTSADYPGTTSDASLSFDADGNNTADSGSSPIIGNHVTDNGTYRYQYDADGNLIRQTSDATGQYTTYSYDYRNRLTDATTYSWSSGYSTLVPGQKVLYTYDYQNRLISKEVDTYGTNPATSVVGWYAISGEARFYDGDNLAMVRTLDTTTPATTVYMWGAQTNQLLSEDVDGQPAAWMVTDGQQSVRGEVVSDHLAFTMEYTVLGALRTSVTTTPRFTYTGQELDASTGLMDYGQRWYDPNSGRFITPDPKGFAAGDTNLYRYVGNNFTDRMDPDGTTAARTSSISSDPFGFLNTSNNSSSYSSSFGFDTPSPLSISPVASTSLFSSGSFNDNTSSAITTSWNSQVNQTASLVSTASKTEASWVNSSSSASSGLLSSLANTISSNSNSDNLISDFLSRPMQDITGQVIGGNSNSSAAPMSSDNSSSLLAGLNTLTTTQWAQASIPSIPWQASWGAPAAGTDLVTAALQFGAGISTPQSDLENWVGSKFDSWGNSAASNGYVAGGTALNFVGGLMHTAAGFSNPVAGLSHLGLNTLAVSDRLSSNGYGVLSSSGAAVLYGAGSLIGGTQMTETYFNEDFATGATIGNGLERSGHFAGGVFALSFAGVGASEMTGFNRELSLPSVQNMSIPTWAPEWVRDFGNMDDPLNQNLSAAKANSNPLDVAAENAAAEVPSSRVLGQNLEDAGITRPADSAAHHIVAGTDARAAEARAILQGEGIGINEADNGVFLPKNSTVPNPAGAQVHSVVHTNVYYNAVNAALRNAPAGTIRDVLTDIANQLSGGAFPH